MSLLLATGFDTTPSDADLRTQGWMSNLALVPTYGRAFSSPLTRTGIPGRSLRLGGYQSNTNLVGSSRNGDPGVFNTGKTINQLWNNGGFVIGARMKFNGFDTSGLESENDGWTGGMASANTSGNQVVVDGNNIYAIRKVTDASGVFVLQKSTDGGMSWTTIASPPLPSALTGESTLSIVEPGTLFVGRGTTMSGPSYTKDDGITWTQITTAGGTGSRFFGDCIATGVPAYPYAMAVGNSNASSGAGIWVSSGTLDGPWTNATPTSLTAAANPTGPLKFLPGLDSKLYAAFSAGWIASINLATGTGGAMIRPNGTNLISAQIYTLDYYKGSLLMGTNFGVYRATTIDGVWTAITAAPMYASVLDGDALVMVGADSSVYSTTDGLALTGTSYNGGPNLSNYTFRGIVPFKGQFISWMTNGSFWNCEKPSLRINAAWECLRWPETTELTVRNQSGFGLVGAVPASINAREGTFTIPASPQGATSAGLWINAGAYSAASRPVTIGQPGLTPITSALIPCSRPADPVQLSNYRYYELIAIADPNVVNAFFYALRVDGGYYIPKSKTSVALAATTDTTTLALVNLPRSGGWTQFDDLYVSDYFGTRNKGVIGPINIMLRTMTNDVVSEWDKVGTAATQAATVTKRGISSDLSNYLTSVVPGATSSFTSAGNASPDLSSYNVRAIQVEAYVKKVADTDPNIILGVGEVASPVIPVAVNGLPNFVSYAFPVNPQGAAWNIANVPGLVVAVRNSGA